jgi:hypothetical protein
MRYALSAASHKVTAKAVRLGTVEALDETATIEKAVAEFKTSANS